MTRKPLLIVLIGGLASLMASAPCAGDWIVYLGGGMQETKGTWQLQGRQVRFHTPSGTLLSMKATEIDLPASSFLSWQIGDRREVPGGASRQYVALEQESGSARRAGQGCVRTRVESIVSAETLVLATDRGPETVHLACVDGPETRHRFKDLARFGHVSWRAVDKLIGDSRTVCVDDEDPPQRDQSKHRIVYASLADGRDLGSELVGRGYALTRSASCTRAGHYLALEAEARQKARGHWGKGGQGIANTIIAQTATFSAAPAGGGFSSGGG